MQILKGLFHVNGSGPCMSERVCYMICEIILPICPARWTSLPAGR